MEIKLIRAFIASPGGLESERRAAFAAAEEINRSVARPLGARLELLGWEETLSGVGRPQAIINSDMETCDLFIGVMWTTWGSAPALDGPYSSGFEEEFELSRDRYKRTQSPIMSMYFKSIDEMQFRDPGAELKKVLAFQERLRNEKAFLYETFSDADGFAAKVRTFLSTHVIRILREGSETGRDQTAKTAPDIANEHRIAAADGERPAGNVLSSAPREEAYFLVHAAEALNRDDGLPADEVARLRLIAATSGKAGNDHQLVAVHDANLIYEHRTRYSLSNWEKRGLLAAGLANQAHQNVPLWSWLGVFDRSRPALLIALSAVAEDDVRVGALAVMRMLERPLSGHEIAPETVVLSWFAEERPASVRLAALQYLRDVGTAAELPFVEEEIDRANKDTIDAALAAALGILLRKNESDAARRLLSASFESMSDETISSVLPHFGELASDELVLGLDHRSAQVRARTINLLAQRGTLSLETMKRASEDDAAVVRLAAVEAFDKVGQPLSLDEAEAVMGRSRKASSFYLGSSRDNAGEALFDRYRAARLGEMPIKSLKALLGSSLHRDAAYFALAARDVDDLGQQLRADIRDGFRTYFANHWPNGIKETPTGLFNALAFREADPAQTKRRDLTRTALDVVARRRNRNDLALIRATLDIGEITPTDAIIACLASLGDQSDVHRLGKTSQFCWPYFDEEGLEGPFNRAAKAILKVHLGDFRSLIFAELSDAMRARIIDFATWADVASLTDGQIVDLLLSDHEQLKRAAARKAAAGLPRRRVAKVLAKYKDDPNGRYYVVTYWLDLGIGMHQRDARRVVTNAR